MHRVLYHDLIGLLNDYFLIASVARPVIWYMFTLGTILTYFNFSLPYCFLTSL